MSMYIYSDPIATVCINIRIITVDGNYDISLHWHTALTSSVGIQHEHALTWTCNTDMDLQVCIDMDLDMQH